MKDIKNLSDEELVAFVRSSDKEAYVQVVRRYQEKLLWYVAKIVNDNYKSEDIVQNTFIKAYVNLKSFNTKRKFSSWIYRIAHNEAINHLKKYQKEVSLEGNGWINRIKDEGNLEEKLEKKEARTMLKKVLTLIIVVMAIALVATTVTSAQEPEATDGGLRARGDGIAVERPSGESTA